MQRELLLLVVVIAMPALKRPTSFSFDEFYRAFSKSVAADVVFADGEVRIVQQQQQTPDASSGTSVSQSHRDHDNESTDASDSLSPALSNRASALDGPPLPSHIAALAALQEADGSWKYSLEFAFVLNGVAPAPPEGIAGKTWATCICVSVWRQSPECFAQLDASYQKALLHCDDNVLRRVRSLIDFGSLHNVRTSTRVCVTERRLSSAPSELMAHALTGERADSPVQQRGSTSAA